MFNFLCFASIISKCVMCCDFTEQTIEGSHSINAAVRDYVAFSILSLAAAAFGAGNHWWLR